MALPTNDHHVHSDGYRSDKGEPDMDRKLREMADECEEIPGVESVWPEADYVEVEHDQAGGAIEDLARSWDCIVEHGDVAVIRPE